MRFKTRYDRWLMCVLGVGAVVTCGVMPLMRLYGAGDHPAPLVLIFLPWLLWAAVLFATLPQYYETRPDALFLRQGWRKIVIPYDDLSELRSTMDSRSAGVYSSQRIGVITRQGKLYIIAVADEDGFFAEVAKRAPHLSRTALGLGTSLTAPVGR
jgi:hypothetical protein